MSELLKRISFIALLILFSIGLLMNINASTTAPANGTNTGINSSETPPPDKVYPTQQNKIIGNVTNSSNGLVSTDTGESWYNGPEINDVEPDEVDTADTNNRWYIGDEKKFTDDYRGWIWVYKNGGREHIELKTGNTITVVQTIDPVINNRYGILAQPNIYCVERGKKLGLDKYLVGSEIQVTDPVLNYILCHGPKMTDGMEQLYSAEPSQVALWIYMFNNSCSCENNGSCDWCKITDNGRIKSGEQYFSQCGDKDKENALELYNNAKNYAEYTYNNPPSVSLTQEGSFVIINYGGNFDRYKIEITKGSEITTVEKTKAQAENDNYEYQIVAGTANEISVKVTGYYNAYSAKYRILQNSERQRLIAVTTVGSENESKVTDKTIEMTTNVSLQKYITQVNGVNVSTSRKNKGTEGDGDPITNNKAYISTSNNSNDEYYKNSNPVEIEVGDTVTYRIYVYNNGDTTAENVTVEDIIPKDIDISIINTIKR